MPTIGSASNFTTPTVSASFPAFFRRRQFSVRALLITCGLLSCILAWVTSRASQDYAAAMYLEGHGIHCSTTAYDFNRRHLVRDGTYQPTLTTLWDHVHGKVRYAFYLKRAGLSPELSGLTRLRSLECLDLSGMPNAKANLKYALSHSRMRHLILSHTDLEDSDLEHMVRMPSLWYLDVSFTRLTDKCVEQLSQLTGLGYVSLEGCDMSIEAIQRLESQLPLCRIDLGDLEGL